MDVCAYGCLIMFAGDWRQKGLLLCIGMPLLTFPPSSPSCFLGWVAWVLYYRKLTLYGGLPMLGNFGKALSPQLNVVFREATCAFQERNCAILESHLCISGKELCICFQRKGMARCPTLGKDTSSHFGAVFDHLMSSQAWRARSV